MNVVVSREGFLPSGCSLFFAAAMQDMILGLTLLRGELPAFHSCHASQLAKIADSGKRGAVVALRLCNVGKLILRCCNVWIPSYIAILLVDERNFNRSSLEEIHNFKGNYQPRGREAPAERECMVGVISLNRENISDQRLKSAKENIDIKRNLSNFV